MKFFHLSDLHIGKHLYRYSLLEDQKYVLEQVIEAAKREGADYSVDVYPHYGSDVETTLYSGFDIRHGLIGPGVYASHCYERSHRDGVKTTLLVLKGYLNI